MYQERRYRNLIDKSNFTSFQVSVKETDLYIRAYKDLREETREIVLRYRYQIEEYIKKTPEFQSTLVPIQVDPFAPKIVKTMMEVSRLTRVGPMAAVAGSISESVGRDLLELSKEVIVENGGDIFLKISKEARIGIHAGASPLSDKVGIKIDPADTPLGVSTSSGTVGHSLSFGRADAVTVISRSAPLADAAATSIGNIIQDAGDFDKGLELARRIEGIKGLLIIVGEKMVVWGDVELFQL